MSLEFLSGFCTSMLFQKSKPPRPIDQRGRRLAAEYVSGYLLGEWVRILVYGYFIIQILLAVK